MIEVIYKDDENAASNERAGGLVKLPKNVTQIGQGDGNGRLKIYIENQLLKSIKEKSEDGVIYGVLLGKKERDDVEYIFVKNYVEVKNNRENIILFNDDIWLYIYDEIKKKGYEGDIVGWYVNFPENRVKNLGQLKKLHLDNFAGINKLLFCYEEENSEEGVYIYNNNMLEKQPVYYVYWGKGSTAKSPSGAVMEKKENKEPGEKVQERPADNIRRMPWGSVAVIAILIGVLAFMGNSGMLKSITDRAQNLIENSGEENPPIVNDVDALNKTTGKEDSNDNVTDSTTESGESETTDVGAKPSEETSTDNIEETTTSNNYEAETTSTEEETTGEEETTESDQASGNVSGTVYIVQAGETLYDISRSFYGSLEMVEKIIEANNIENPDKILAGQKLILPDK